MGKFRGALFVMAGLVMALVSLWQTSSSWLLGRDGRRAQATVIALNAGPAHPQLRFVTERGETIEYPQGGLVNQAVGDKVEVLYDPANPHDAVLATFGARYGFALLDGLLGFALLVAGAFSLKSKT